MKYNTTQPLKLPLFFSPFLLSHVNTECNISYIFFLAVVSSIQPIVSTWHCLALYVCNFSRLRNWLMYLFHMALIVNQIYISNIIYNFECVFLSRLFCFSALKCTFTYFKFNCSVDATYTNRNNSNSYCSCSYCCYYYYCNNKLASVRSVSSGFHACKKYGKLEAAVHWFNCACSKFTYRRFPLRNTECS